MRLITPYSLSSIKDINSVGISAEDTSEFSNRIPEGTIFTSVSPESWIGDTLIVIFESHDFLEREYKSIYLRLNDNTRAIIVEDTLQKVRCRTLEFRITFDEKGEEVSVFNRSIVAAPYLNDENPYYSPIVTDGEGAVKIVDSREVAEELNKDTFRSGLIVRNNKTFNPVLKYLFTGVGNKILGVFPRLVNGRPTLSVSTRNGYYQLFYDDFTGFKNSELPYIEGFTLTEYQTDPIICGFFDFTNKLDRLSNLVLSTDYVNTIKSYCWEVIKGDNDILVYAQNEEDYILATYEDIAQALETSVSNVKDLSKCKRYIFKDTIVVSYIEPAEKLTVVLNKTKGSFYYYKGDFIIIPYKDTVIFGVNYAKESEESEWEEYNCFVDVKGNIVNTDFNLFMEFPINIFDKNYLIRNLDTIVCIDE